MRIAELLITSFSKEGHGQAEWTNKEGYTAAVEVPFTAPGDLVTVELGKKRRGILEGNLLEIITPSPDRIKPRCIHFGSCGGCRWQHIPYTQQLQVKEERIRTLLSPYVSPEMHWHPIIPSDPPWEYRNKMELSFSSDKANHHYLGLILHASRGKVFQMKECHLAHPWFVQTVNAVTQWWDESEIDAYHMYRNTGSLRTLTLREGQMTGDRLVMLTVSGNPDYALKKHQLNSFIEALKNAATPSLPDAKLSIFLRIQQIAKGHPTNFFEMVLAGPDHVREILHIKVDNQPDYSMTFRISPSAFFQPNTRQAEKLYSRALSLAKLSPDDLVYDLYCGTGTLGLCASRQVKEVVGIEINPDSVVDARENVKINGITNYTIRQGDVGKVLAELESETKRNPNVVLVDPPRAGLDANALKHLMELNSPRIIYVSCNPTTQVMNLDVLIQVGGYKVEAVQPVDQFPQTIHVENIIVLTKK